MTFRKGSEVSWRWGADEATGTVVERFERTVSRTLKGSKITRKGTPECPAYLIEQDDGDRVLKLESELDRA
jgi:hypothetical protein